jgi:hypothetical protein
MLKKISTLLIVAIALVGMIACGGGSKTELSPEMKDFTSMLKGTSNDVSQALAKYAVDSLKNNDMGMYNLKSPEVKAKEGDCYTFEANSGATVRTYKVCWTGGKIVKIDDLGMK